jgi:hypothetical protein
MATWNALSSAVFDRLLAPFGHGPAWFDLVVWSAVAGVFALLVYKAVSDQRGIARAKARIQVHLYEIRLFRHDPLAVLASTGRVLLRNVAYLGHNLLPMAVLLVPMLAVLAQLEAHYAFAPVPVGSVDLLRVRLDPAAPVPAREVRLELPDGVALDAPPVRTADGEIFWRLRAEAPGDHLLALRVATRRSPRPGRWAARPARSRSSAPRAGRRSSTRASRRWRGARRSTRSPSPTPSATWASCRAASSASSPPSSGSRSRRASR